METSRATKLTRLKSKKAFFSLASAAFFAAASRPALANSFFGHVVELVPSAARPLPGIPLSTDAPPNMNFQFGDNATVDLGGQSFLFGFKQANYVLSSGEGLIMGTTPPDGKVLELVVEGEVINGAGEALLDYEYRSTLADGSLTRTSCEFRLSESKFTEGGPLHHIATLPQPMIAPSDNYFSLNNEFRTNIPRSGTYVFQMFCNPGDNYFIWKMRAMGTQCVRDDSVTDPLACKKP